MTHHSTSAAPVVPRLRQEDRIRLRWWAAVLAIAAAAMACNLGSQPFIPTVPPIVTLIPSQTPFFTVASPTPFGTPILNPNPAIPTLAGAFVTAPVNTVNCRLNSAWPRYTVQGGDTLYAIAVLTGATVDTLISANCLSNPDFLQVGQRLYVPRMPAYPTATYANPVQVKFQIAPQPAQLINGQYRVSGQFQIIATGVTIGSRVVLYYSYPGSSQNYLAEALVFNGAAQVTVNAQPFANLPLFYVTAVSRNAAGQNVQYADPVTLTVASGAVTVTPVLPSPTPSPALNVPQIGALSVSPAQPVYDPGLRYALQDAAPVTLTVTGLQNAFAIQFLLFPAQNAEPLMIAQISNPGNAAQMQALWTVVCNRATGKLVAQAVGPTGATSLSNSLDVFCLPNP